MAFKMGEVFSPSTLGQVLEAQKMAQSGGKWELLGGDRDEDRFKWAQLNASREENAADRQMRREMAQIEMNLKNADTEEERRRWEAESSLAREKYEATAPGSEYSEWDKKMRQQEADYEGRRAAASEEANRIRLGTQIGFDEPYGEGSMAASRAASAQNALAGVEAKKAQAEKWKAESELIHGRIMGTIPPSMQEKERNQIERDFNLWKKEIQMAKDARDLINVALNFLKTMRDPVSGALKLEGGQAFFAKMQAGLFKEARNRPQGDGEQAVAILLDAMSGQMHKNAIEDDAAATLEAEQEDIRKKQAAAAGKPYVSKEEEDSERFKQGLGLWDFVREQQKKGALPPSNVGK